MPVDQEGTVETAERTGKYVKIPGGIEKVFLTSFGYDLDNDLIEVEPEDPDPCSECKKTGHLAIDCPRRKARAERNKNRKNNRLLPRAYRCKNCRLTGDGCTADNCVHHEQIEDGVVPVPRPRARSRSRSRHIEVETPSRSELPVAVNSQSSPRNSRSGKRSRITFEGDAAMRNVNTRARGLRRESKEPTSILRNGNDRDSFANGQHASPDEAMATTLNPELIPDPKKDQGNSKTGVQPVGPSK